MSKKRVHKKSTKKAEATHDTESVESTAIVAAVEPAEEVEDGWQWTPQKEQALELALRGVSQRQIARDVNVHYNTVGNWFRKPEFAARLAEESAKLASSVRLRRIQETNAFTSRIAALANKTLKVAEESPESQVAADHALTWLDAYKSFREEERINSGENVQHHEIHGMVGHVHAGVRQESFKNFLSGVIEKGVIDVESIETQGDDANAVVMGVLQAALREGDVLDIITEEDRIQALKDGDLK